MRITSVIAGFAASLVLTGCSLDPFDEGNPAVVGEMSVRIVNGPRSGLTFHPSVNVRPGNDLELRVEVGAGRTVEVDLPRTGRGRIVPRVREENQAETLATTQINAMDPGPLAVDRLYKFQPTYVAIEEQSTASQLSVRLTVPNLPETGVNSVPVTFRTDVVEPASGSGR